LPFRVVLEEPVSLHTLDGILSRRRKQPLENGLEGIDLLGFVSIFFRAWGLRTRASCIGTFLLRAGAKIKAHDWLFLSHNQPSLTQGPTTSRPFSKLKLAAIRVLRSAVVKRIPICYSSDQEVRPNRNYNIMRPISFRSEELRALLLRNRIATLDELKQALGTPVNVTLFRKLKPLDYLTSYSHRGRYYTLREIARFDDNGLWSQAEVWFSRFGTLLATAEQFVERSPRGYFADELASILHVQVQDALHQLSQQGRVSRQIVSSRYLYTAIDPTVQRQQLLARRTVEFLPTVVDPSVLHVSPQEVKAAILLFYSLLDEQQRRLYAGLESLLLGRGGDRQLADFLDLDPHTVARGRQQLLAQDVEVDRVRKTGGGRKRVEKNARNSRGHRDSSGARYGRRSHHRIEVDPQNDREDRRGSPTDPYPGVGQHRRPSFVPNGFLSACQSQADCHQLQPVP
jgi:hypothetical protein